MCLCRIIGSLIAAAFILVGAALLWRAIDEEDKATPMGSNEKMGYRYDVFGIFFVGFLTVLYAFFAEKFPKFSGITTLTCIGIIMYTITQSDKHNAAAVNLWRMGVQCDSPTSLKDFTDAQYRYFAGLVLSYIGFFLAVSSQAGMGLGSDYKIAKILMLIIVTGCAIVAIFLLATLQSTATVDTLNDCKYSYKYTTKSVGATNAIAVGVTFYIWFLAAMAILSGNKELAGGVCVLVGVYQFFSLHFLLDLTEVYEDTVTFDSDELKSARAGWIFAWFVGFCALIAAIPVYASEDGSVKA